MRFSVFLTPGGVAPSRRSTAVVIDVLRATTTLTVALANGASRLVPVATPDEAFAARSREPDALLCGERDGRKIAGFDLGNSPEEYSPEVVRGRALIFASTNGSLALLAARSARRRLLGCFANASALLRAIEGEDEVAVICAGKLGRFSLEDTALAGWLCERLVEKGARIENEAAALARTIAPRDPREALALVEGSSHGRYLRSLGGAFARDVRFCSEMDRLDRVFEIGEGGAPIAAGPRRS